MIHKLSKHCCKVRKEELLQSIKISNEVMNDAHIIIGSLLFQIWEPIKEDLIK